jgi:hypothetical protein
MWQKAAGGEFKSAEWGFLSLESVYWGLMISDLVSQLGFGVNSHQQLTDIHQRNYASITPR